MGSAEWPHGVSRRTFLQGLGAAAIAPPLLGACGGDGEEVQAPTTAAPQDVGAPDTTVFVEPSSPLSGSLSILLWSHFVPSHDEWFDPFVSEWATANGISYTVDHINNAEIPGRITAEIAAGQGHDLIQYIAGLSQFEPSALDMTDVVEEAERRYGPMLDLCRRSSFNPNTEKFFAYAPGWVPDPGNYRKSLWEGVGMPDGPSTWEELLEGGREVKARGVQMGIGMSQEIDSNMAARALIWSFGGSIQDENENVVINSPEVIDAVEFMSRLYADTMTEEVFAWNAASNNQGLAAGSLSYILNSISAYRTAQEQNPAVADDIFFVPALKGPDGGQLAAEHVLYNWIIPNHAQNPDAAKEFLLHYTANFAHATYNSKLYDFPSFVDRVPNLNAWMADDPFGSTPSDKLGFLTIDEAVEWSTNIGHPGPQNTAVGEVFGTFIIPNMMAKAARGELSAKEAVEDAEAQIKPIYEKWRSQGLVGGWRSDGAPLMGAVETVSLTKRYAGSDRNAVDDVSIATEDGEYLVLLGPSGCGKTTLLRMIAGLEPPTSGTVKIGGDVVDGLPPRARRIAMVFQSYALYPHKTVEQNIVFPLKAEKLPGPERKRRTQWASGLLGIEHLLQRKPRHLSGGERQRVALARALVREPSVFLLDEPLSNLDAKLRALARDDLKEFHDRVGTTTIYVTHDQVEAMGMGDRIVVMFGGEVRQIGPPQDVYLRPADTFVATFLGSPPMNLIQRDDAVVGFRPEKALPASVLGGRTDGHVPFDLDVTRIEYLSGDRHLHGVATGLGEPTPVIVRLPATVLTPIDSGSTHSFVLLGDDLRFFDPATERATEPVRVGS